MRVAIAVAALVVPVGLAGAGGYRVLPSAVPAGVAAQGSQPVVTTLTLFACTAEGALRSRDWGREWEPIVRVLPKTADPTEIRPARVFHAVGSRVYLGGAGGLLMSDDFGETWERLAFEGDVRAVLPSRYPQAEPTLFVGTETGLWRSPDAGATFGPTAVEDAVSRIEWPGPALVVASAGGVRVSSDSADTFEERGKGLPDGQVSAMALSSFFAIDPVLFVGVGERGVYRSSDGASTWHPAGLEGHEVTDLLWLGPFLYAVSAEGFFRTEDLGKSWSTVGEGLDGVSPNRMLVPLAPDSGAEMFLAARDGVYQSADAGQNWRRVGLAGRDVTCIATFPPPPPVLDTAPR